MRVIVSSATVHTAFHRGRHSATVDNAASAVKSEVDAEHKLAEDTTASRCVPADEDLRPPLLVESSERKLYAVCWGAVNCGAPVSAAELSSVNLLFHATTLSSSAGKVYGSAVTGDQREMQ